jgi:hypothetical protein
MWLGDAHTREAICTSIETSFRNLYVKYWTEERGVRAGHCIDTSESNCIANYNSSSVIDFRDHCKCILPVSHRKV